MASETSDIKSSDATKSKTDSMTSPKDQEQPAWRLVMSAIVVMALASLASPLSQANLSPVYGSIPAAIYHKRGMWSIAFAANAIFDSPQYKSLRLKPASLLPVLAFWTPVIQWALFRYSSELGCEFGPLLTEALTFYPLLLLASLACSASLVALNGDSPVSGVQAWFSSLLPLTMFYVCEGFFASNLPYVIGKVDFITRTGLYLVIGTAYYFVSQTPFLVLCFPAVLHTIFLNPHHQSSVGGKALNATLAEFNYSLLDRRDSLTGYVSVLEDHANGYRVMRCDHSLLGGEWLVTEDRKSQGQIQRETIYSVFTMLESVRLVNGNAARVDSSSNALFIGLGIGTSPKTFINRGINTTIVELDPAVYEFATQYFDLPKNHHAILEDAVTIVEQGAKSQPMSYDYIIHDVFTGGAEPTALFTFEFLSDLHALLKQDGVIAINYAGDITLPPPKIVLRTIHAVFPTCRMFRDSPPEEGATTFFNMVVFCTKSATKPLTFRQGTEKDWMRSLSRREYVPPSKDLEIKLEDIIGMEGDGEILKKENEAIVEKFHRDHAVRHWKLMRTVLPDGVWENW